MVSGIITLALFLLLVCLWFLVEYRYVPSPHRVSNMQELNARILQFKKSHDTSGQLESPIFVPTGVFVQSFEFLNSNTVRFSGYIWQKISKENLAKGISPGVVFPEANDAVNIELAYDLDYGNYKVFGWNFTGVPLLQNFNYSAYPFDMHSVWIRLWPKDFYRNVILVPDLKSYDSTKPGEIFGLEKDIVRQGFNFRETFFDMPITKYDTNFGIKNDVGQKDSLELYFNTIIERDFFTPFIVNLLPLFLIWVILFLITMMITIDEDTPKGAEFSASNLFTVLGAAVFSVLLLHIGFRRKFVDQPLLFLEYFYLITYIVIILISYDVYTVTNKSRIPRFIKHNLLPKTWFWPVLMAAIVLVTLMEFFVFPKGAVDWYNLTFTHHKN